MPGEIRIDDALGRATISIEPEENGDERAARLEQEREEARFDLMKRRVLFFVFLAALTAVGAISGYGAAFDASASADTKRWAQTVLSALLTGALSFVVGQATATRRP